MYLIISGLIVAALLAISEYWSRKYSLHSELSRKFVHITVGSFVAFWPFFLSWQQIELLSLAFLVVVAASKYLHLLTAIHSVQRPTWGELYFALAVGGVTLLTHNKWIYMAALLQMSLADGFAAVIGQRYGQRRRYVVLRHTKSVLGTLTFLVISLAILIGYSHFAAVHLMVGSLVALAVGATLVENIGVQGLDNLLVPLLVAGVLSLIV